MKMDYLAPEIDLTPLGTIDLLSTSGPDYTPGENELPLVPLP